MPAPAVTPAPAPRRVRGEERNAQLRASLEPLAPGERPPALTIAAVVAAALAAINVVLFLVGGRGTGRAPNLGYFVLYEAILVTAAVGMWRARYWAVLGFQVLLALTIVVAALSLLRASNLAAVALCVAICGLAGWLFWKLVRVMSRLQMPKRPEARA